MVLYISFSNPASMSCFYQACVKEPLRSQPCECSKQGESNYEYLRLLDRKRSRVPPPAACREKKRKRTVEDKVFLLGLLAVFPVIKIECNTNNEHITKKFVHLNLSMRNRQDLWARECVNKNCWKTQQRYTWTCKKNLAVAMHCDIIMWNFFPLTYWEFPGCSCSNN